MDMRVSPASWPLVGRQRELARIADARAAGACGSVIHGPAGVGKTRLAERAVDEARVTGACTHWIRATRSSAALPGAAFAHLLPADAAIEEGARCFKACAEALHEQAAGRALVLGIDDAHLLDPASAALLLYLVDHADAFAVLTIRAGESAPDAVTALWKDGAAVWLDLEELDDAQLIDLAERVLEGQLQHDARRWLTHASRGNVLYAQHLLTGAVDSGSLVEGDGLWRLTRIPMQSTTLRQLLSAEIGMLSEPERCGLELLALAEPLAFVDARTMISETTLAELERKRLVVLEPGNGGGALRLAHPLYGELIVAQMPISRGHTHRAALAALLGGRPSRSPADTLRIAQWLVDSGQPASAELLLEATKAARLIDSGEVERFGRLALAAGAGPAATIAIAAAHTLNHRPAEAETVLAEIEGTITDQLLAFDYLRARTAILQWRLGRAPEALALIERARAWWPNAEWQVRVEILRMPLAALAQPPGALTAQLEAALANPGLPAQARGWLARGLAADLFWFGRVQEARAVLPGPARSRLYEDVDFLQLATWAMIEVAAGADLPELERRLRQAFNDATEAADPAAAGLVATTVALTAYMSGRLLEALHWLNEAMAQASRQDVFSIGVHAGALRVGVLLARGDHAATALAVQRFEHDLAENRSTHPALLVAVARARAWAQLAAAEPQQAQAILIEAAEAFAWAPVYDAELRYEAMRAGRPASQLAEAMATLRSRCDAPLTAAFADHVAARAAGDPQLMLAAADTFTALGANLYAAEAAAHAAAAFAALGRQDSARRAAVRSRELRPDGQGAAPLTIAGVDHAATELTPREAQLVELAARGLSNPEIADRLVLSTRTVETHIYRAMRKLGVNDRQDFRPRDA